MNTAAVCISCVTLSVTCLSSTTRCMAITCLTSTTIDRFTFKPIVRALNALQGFKLNGNDGNDSRKAEFTLECKVFFHRFLACAFLFLSS